MKASSIPIVFITDDGYVMQTCVAIVSLLASKRPDTEYEIFVITADCSDESMGHLRSLPGVRLVNASVAEYQHIAQLAHITRACLLKFNLCELIPTHKKILYLDGDILVRDDLTDLYKTELGDSYAAALYARREPGDSRKKINAGIMLFNAEKMRQDNMKEKLACFRHQLGDYPSMDQQTFNLLLSENMVPLTMRYNCMPIILFEIQERHGWHYINDFFQTSYANLENCVADAAIIHYAAGLKPWKFTHAPCAEEWMMHYRNSPFGREPLQRCGKWGQRQQILFDLYKTLGVSAVFVRLFAFVWHKIIGHKPERIWG